MCRRQDLFFLWFRKKLRALGAMSVFNTFFKLKAFSDFSSNSDLANSKTFRNQKYFSNKIKIFFVIFKSAARFILVQIWPKMAIFPLLGKDISKSWCAGKIWTTDLFSRHQNPSGTPIPAFGYKRRKVLSACVIEFRNLLYNFIDIVFYNIQNYYSSFPMKSAS